MRVTLTVVVLLLLSAASVKAMDPPVIEWERVYFPGDYSIFKSITETNDGGFAVAGLKLPGFGFPTDTSLFKFDSSGNLLWTVSLEIYSQETNKILELSNGDLVAVGRVRITSASTYALAIIRVSPNGEILWTKHYNIDSSHAWAYDLTELPDGGFAICGDIDPTEGLDQAWILRTDSQGDTLWTREWGWEAHDRARGILYIDSVITVLTSGRLEGDPGGTYVIRYSMDGDLLSGYWIPELIGRYGQDMCEASDGGLLILTNNSPTIVHTDYYGNVDWVCGPYPLDRLIVAYGWSIDTTMDGGIIYGGENAWQDPDNPDDLEISGMVNRLDFEGNNLWWDYVYNSNCTHIYSIRQLSQGGYIAAGRAWSPVDDFHGILIKYAPETGIESGDVSTVGITGVSPNPFTSDVSVSFSLPESSCASLSVYDLNGRLVDVITEGSFPAGENTVEWTVPEGVSSGCYLIQYNVDLWSDAETVVHIK